MRPWKSIVIYMTTGLFLLTFTGHLYSPSSQEIYGEDDIVMTGEDFIEKINVTNPLHKNFYIAPKLYKHRLKPQVHLDNKINNYHPVTYFVAAEVARRYNARYIIDLGCGSASKLSKLAGEFNVIGIDYGHNYQKARASYPHLNILEANLDRGKGCYVHLPRDILLQSLVISVDVIEHLTDPFCCYLKLLKYMTRYAMVAIISSPDRERMAAVTKKRQALLGPPINAGHVREWTVYEMDKLFEDNEFQVLFSGWVCNTFKGCEKGYFPHNNPFFQQITALGNMNIRRSWNKGKLSPNSVGIKITVFLILYPRTNKTMADKNVQYLLNERMHIVLIRVNNSIKVDIPIAGRVVVDQYEVTSTADLKQVIQEVFGRPYYQQGDWFYILDAHENILTHHVPMWNVTLRNAFLHIAQEPYSFNSVANSYFFMTKPSGHGGDKTPFKIYGSSAWDSESTDLSGPISDTLKNRVRAWRKLSSKIELDTLVTQRGDTIISDVNFMGRKVYPFHFVSLRTNPRVLSQTKRVLDRTALRMYILDAMIGFMPSSRKRIMTKHFPF